MKSLENLGVCSCCALHSKKKKRRRKSAARHERDRAQAKAYQDSQAQDIRQSDLILPFAGKLLPVNKESLDEHQAAAAVPAEAEAVPAAAVPPPRGSTSGGSRPGPTAVPAVATQRMTSPHLATLNTRKAQSHQKYIDVSVAKKNLFPNPQKSPPSRQQIGPKTYEMKEADIWRKLFI